MRGVRFWLLGLSVLALASCTTLQGAGEAAPDFVGTWRQSEAECAGAEPVREFALRANGDFSVTWMPFETYQDYWGTWTFDARTRVLTLNVAGGNYTPVELAASGVVSVANDQLVLGAMSLGSPRNGARCMAAFRR